MNDEDLELMKRRMHEASGRRASKGKGTRAPETSIEKVERDRDRQDSRAKGARFENETAKKWSRWSGEHLRRTPQSGGWSNARFGVTGDIVCDKKRFPFSIECKAREGWALDDLITGVRCDDERSVRQWWLQTLRQCPDGKTPLLVFKRNRGPVLVMMRSIDWQRIMLRQPAIGDYVPAIKTYVDDAEVVVLSQDLFHGHCEYNKSLRIGLKGRGDGYA